MSVSRRARREAMKKRTSTVSRVVRRRWSCSNFAAHEHRFLWSARLCGYVQYLYHRLTGSPLL